MLKSSVSRVVFAWKMGNMRHKDTPYGFPFYSGSFLRLRPGHLQYLWWQPDQVTQDERLTSFVLKRLGKVVSPDLFVSTFCDPDSTTVRVIDLVDSKLHSFSESSLAKCLMRDWVADASVGNSRSWAPTGLQMVDWRTLRDTDFDEDDDLVSPLVDENKHTTTTTIELVDVVAWFCHQVAPMFDEETKAWVWKGTWALSRGKTVTGMVSNRTQFHTTVEQVPVGAKLANLPLPSDHVFRSDAAFWTHFCTGNATLLSGLFWTVLQRLDPAKKLVIAGQLVKDVHMADGTYEGNMYESIQDRFRRPELPDGSDGPVSATVLAKTEVLSNTGHTWLVIETEAGVRMHVDMACSQFGLEKSGGQQKNLPVLLDSEKKVGHLYNEIKSFTLSSGWSVPSEYWVKPDPLPDDGIITLDEYLSHDDVTRRNLIWAHLAQTLKERPGWTCQSNQKK
jgi:hypothetical protein